MKQLLFIKLLILFMLLLTLSGVLAQEGNELRAFELRWSPDGQWIGVGSSNGGWIFDAQDFKAEPYHYFDGSEVFVVAFDPLRPYAAFAPGDGQRVRVLEIESGQEVYNAFAPQTGGELFSVFYDLGYSDDGRFLSVGNTASLYVFDAESGELLQDLAYPDPNEPYTSSSWLTSLDYGTVATTVLASDWNGRLLAFNVESGGRPTEHSLARGYDIERLEIVPGTNRVVVQNPSDLYTYDLRMQTFEPLNVTEGERIAGFDLSPDGERLAVGTQTTWYLYDLVNNQVIREFISTFNGTELPDRIYSLAFNPAGDRVATLQTDGQLKIWDLATGEVIAELGEFTSGVSQRWG